jgi:uncharacterized protein (TIGR03086 family)
MTFSALPDVLDDLATLVGDIPPDQGAEPTPCEGMDVAAMRSHVVGWLAVFAAALSDPDGGDRPDPKAHPAPDDPAEAAADVRRSAGRVRAAIADGVADRPVRLLGDDPLPGQMVLAMLTAEAVAHGWDLASATGRPWHPDEALCDAARGAMGGMLKPEYRGPDKSFGPEVPVADDAPALDRLLAFSGRDPHWKP